MSGPQEHPLVGKTIAAVRLMTKDESFWDEDAILLELDDGGSLFAMRDPEGNGPGTLVHHDVDGHEFYVWHEEEESRPEPRDEIDRLIEDYEHNIATFEPALARMRSVDLYAEAKKLLGTDLNDDQLKRLEGLIANIMEVQFGLPVGTARELINKHSNET